MESSDISFERDIRPLFREIDVQYMGYLLDLSAYDDVKRMADKIHQVLVDGEMPCDGPWSKEDVAKFRAWMDWGFKP